MENIVQVHALCYQTLWSAQLKYLFLDCVTVSGTTLRIISVHLYPQIALPPL